MEYYEEISRFIPRKFFSTFALHSVHKSCQFLQLRSLLSYADDTKGFLTALVNVLIDLIINILGMVFSHLLLSVVAIISE